MDENKKKRMLSLWTMKHGDYVLLRCGDGKDGQPHFWYKEGEKSTKDGKKFTAKSWGYGFTDVELDEEMVAFVGGEKTKEQYKDKRGAIRYKNIQQVIGDNFKLGKTFKLSCYESDGKILPLKFFSFEEQKEGSLNEVRI